MAITACSWILCKMELLAFLLMVIAVFPAMVMTQTAYPSSTDIFEASYSTPRFGCGGFRCSTTGLCIPLTAVCDYNDDCGDGEDEKRCADSEACATKRIIVDQILKECALTKTVVQSRMYENLTAWTFEMDNLDVDKDSYVIELTLDMSQLNITEPALFLVNIASDLSFDETNITFLFTNTSNRIQTRPLASLVYFHPPITARLRRLEVDKLIPVTTSGTLNLTIASGECENVTLNCLLYVGDSISENGNCPQNLGDLVYKNLYFPDELCDLKPECADGEFSCSSGICVPNDVLCDGYYDCGEREDESMGCPEECQNLRLSSELRQCYNHTRFGLISQGTTEELKLTMGDTGNFYFTDILLDVTNVPFSGHYLARLNITTPSSSIVVHQRWSPMDTLLYVNLKSPLPVKPGELITITVESTNDVFREPWRPKNVSFLQLVGIQLFSSCEKSRVCVESLTGYFPDSFTLTKFKRFFLDQYQPCFEPPRITFISQNASVTPGYPYVVICEAEGFPTPTIDWLDGNMERYLPQLGASFRKIQLTTSETFKEVTCRASHGSSYDQKTVRVSRIGSKECETNLMGTYGEDCLFVKNEVFQGYALSVTGPLLYNVTLLCHTSYEERNGLIIDLVIEIKPFYRGLVRRGLGDLLHRNEYKRIICDEQQRAMIIIQPPLLISTGNYSVSVGVANTLGQDLGVYGYHDYKDYSYGFSEDYPAYGVSPIAAGFMNCNLSCSLDKYVQVINSCPDYLFIPELEATKIRLKSIRTCLGTASNEPIITVHPDEILESPAGGSFDTSCDGDNIVLIKWYKKDLYGDTATSISGNVLSFSRFNAGDQGIYFCRAQGGEFKEVFVDSKPVLVLLSGRDTYLMEMRFNGLNYSDELADPTSRSFVTNSSNIHAHISDNLLEFMAIEDSSDVIVQRLRPGSVIAESLVTLATTKTVTDAKNILAYDAFEVIQNLAPDNQSLFFQSTSFCEAESLNDTLAGKLTFMRTIITQVAQSVELCPIYTTRVGEPRATRICIGDFVSPSAWQDPVLNNCFDGEDSEEETDVLENLSEFVENNPVTDDNVTEVSRDVADATHTTDLDGEDLVIVAELLETITNVNSSSPEVTSNVVEIVDNILQLEDNTYGESISAEAPSRILQALEGQLTNLHRGEDVNFTNVREFIGTVAFSADKELFSSQITFGNFFTSDEQNIDGNLNESLTDIFRGTPPTMLNDNIKASITLPKSLLDGIQYDTVPVTFIIHRTSHLFVSTGSRPKTEEVESLVIAATIEGKKIANLDSPVVTRFYLLPLEGVGDDRRCVFWNVSLADGFGAWSSEGCELVYGSEENGDSIVECMCNHLTNFAVLVDVQGDIGNVVLDVLSIIGCVVSVIALVITIVSFLAIKKLRSKQPQQILINLSFALLGLYLSFLIGINQANLKTGCIIFGALIHYFCLASLSWMCVEATNMYLLFVKVFDSGIRSFMKKAALAAWGLPLVVVVVSVAVKSANYRGDYCFPQAGTLTFYIGVLLLIVVMLGYNMVMFTFIIREVTCRRKFDKKDSKKENIKRIQNAISISVLLGLSWLFGFLAIGGAQFIFNLLFLIFNSLQGLFVFLLFCLRNEEVRKEWIQATLPLRYQPSVQSSKASIASDTTSTRFSGTKPKGNRNGTTEKVEMVVSTTS